MLIICVLLSLQSALEIALRSRCVSNKLWIHTVMECTLYGLMFTVHFAWIIAFHCISAVLLAITHTHTADIIDELYIMLIFTLLMSVTNYALERRRKIQFVAKSLSTDLSTITEGLLQSIIPFKASSAIMDGQFAERIADCVVVVIHIHSDLSCSTIRPRQTVNSLKAVFHAFDLLCVATGCEKIKTFGTSFMAIATNETSADKDTAAAQFGLTAGMLLTTFCRAESPISGWSVGMAHGPIIIGAVGGARTVHIEIWGEAVSRAATMAQKAGPFTVMAVPTLKCDEALVVKATPDHPVDPTPRGGVGATLGVALIPTPALKAALKYILACTPDIIVALSILERFTVAADVKRQASRSGISADDSSASSDDALPKVSSCIMPAAFGPHVDTSEIELHQVTPCNTELQSPVDTDSSTLTVTPGPTPLMVSVGLEDGRRGACTPRVVGGRVWSDEITHNHGVEPTHPCIATISSMPGLRRRDAGSGAALGRGGAGHVILPLNGPDSPTTDSDSDYDSPPQRDTGRSPTGSMSRPWGGSRSIVGEWRGSFGGEHTTETDLSCGVSNRGTPSGSFVVATPNPGTSGHTRHHTYPAPPHPNLFPTNALFAATEPNPDLTTSTTTPPEPRRVLTLESTADHTTQPGHGGAVWVVRAMSFIFDGIPMDLSFDEVKAIWSDDLKDKSVIALSSSFILLIAHVILGLRSPLYAFTDANTSSERGLMLGEFIIYNIGVAVLALDMIMKLYIYNIATTNRVLPVVPVTALSSTLLSLYILLETSQTVLTAMIAPPTAPIHTTHALLYAVVVTCYIFISDVSGLATRTAMTPVVALLCVGVIGALVYSMLALFFGLRADPRASLPAYITYIFAVPVLTFMNRAAMASSFLSTQSLARRQLHMERMVAAVLPQHLIRRLFIDSDDENDQKSSVIPFVSYSHVRRTVGQSSSQELSRSTFDYVTSCTVMEIDFVNFSSVVESRSADEIIELLNQLFSRLDRCASEFNVKNVKTMGDRAVYVCGLFDEVTDHAILMCQAALAITRVIGLYAVSQTLPLELRIGVASGPAFGSVYGSVRFNYDILGPAVTRAAELEKSCPPGAIHVSRKTVPQLGSRFKLVADAEGFVLNP